MQIDARDRLILSLLQADCRLSNAELAEKVGMSASACWRRVRTFEDEGIIKRYRAEISAEGVGFTFQALVHVHLTRHNPEHLAGFVAAVEARPEVQDCYATTGQADYYLRVLCRDIVAYNLFLEDFLFNLPAVASAQTNVVLREIKRSQAISM